MLEPSYGWHGNEIIADDINVDVFDQWSDPNDTWALSDRVLPFIKKVNILPSMWNGGEMRQSMLSPPVVIV